MLYLQPQLVSLGMLFLVKPSPGVFPWPSHIFPFPNGSDVAAMSAAGVVHPPAGAHATIWADADHNWYFYMIVIVCSAVSVLPATLINNMSLKRQYPIYWGYGPRWLYERHWVSDSKDKTVKK